MVFNVVVMMLASGLVQQEAPEPSRIYEQALLQHEAAKQLPEGPALLSLLLPEAAGFQVPVRSSVAGAPAAVQPLQSPTPPRVLARMLEEDGKLKSEAAAEPEAFTAYENPGFSPPAAEAAAEEPKKEEGFDFSNLSITIGLATVLVVVKALGALGIIGDGGAFPTGAQ